MSLISGIGGKTFPSRNTEKTFVSLNAAKFGTGLGAPADKGKEGTWIRVSKKKMKIQIPS